MILFGNLNGRGDCEPLLARVLQEISRPFHLENAVAHISASIGVTIFSHDHSESEKLLQHADQAMYNAKRLGKSQYSFFSMSHINNDHNHV